MRIHFLILSAERLCRPWREPSECTLRTCGDMDRPEKTELEMDGKIYRDSEIGDIMLRKSRRCRRVSIRVHPVRGVVVTVPYYVPYEAGVMFLLSKRQWVLSVMARQKAVSVPPAGPDPAMTEALRREARRYLPERLASIAARYGFVYGRLAIKNNRSNWGSCSTKDNINLNLRLMQVPEHLRDYVMLHELCHLRHHDHGPGFHRLLEDLCADYFATVEIVRGKTVRTYPFPLTARSGYPVSRSLEKELKAYRPV